MPVPPWLEPKHKPTHSCISDMLNETIKSFRPNATQCLLLLFLCTALASGGCNRVGDYFVSTNESAPLAPSELTVNVFQVGRDERAIETAVFFGTLEPNRQSRLGFGRGGRVKNIFKQIGEKSLSGEKLVEQEQELLENQKLDVAQKLAQARQNLQAGEANLQATAQQQIPGLESQLRGIELELAKGIITAPYDCIVAEKNVEVGDLVSQTSPALKVIEDKKVLVKTNLPRKIADALSVGQSVWVGIDDQSVAAEIKSKSPVETSAGGTMVTLQIAGELTTAWTYGQSVEIRFFMPTQNSGFWIPLSALTREAGGLWSVLTVKNATSAITADDEQLELTQKMLEIVQLEDEWALSQGALVDGELVVVNGSHRVVTGQRVRTNDVTGSYKKPGAGANE